MSSYRFSPLLLSLAFVILCTPFGPVDPLDYIGMLNGEEIGLGLAKSIQRTRDGGYIIGSYSSGVDRYKLSSDLKIEWEKTSENLIEDVIQTVDGGYAIVGGVNFNPENFRLTKLDANGLGEWNNFFYAQEIYGRSILQASDGGFLITGSIITNNSSNRMVLVLKTDSVGKEEWVRSFGREFNDEGYDIINTTDNSYVILGSSESSSGGDRDSIVIKIDQMGDEKWSYVYGENQDEIGYSIIEKADGSYIFMSSRVSSDGYWSNAFVRRIDADGLVIWEQLKEMNLRDNPVGLIESEAGNNIAVGTLGSRLLIFEFNNDGDVIWEQRYGHKKRYVGIDITRSTDGYILLGHYEEEPQRASPDSPTEIINHLYYLEVDIEGKAENDIITVARDGNIEY